MAAIFQGMQNILTKQFYATNKSSPPPESEQKKSPFQHQRLPIEPAKTLLEIPSRQTLIKNWPTRMSFSEENYANHCQPLLDNFVEFTQQLPETLTSYYAHTGGLIDHALERTDTALTLVRGYFLPDGSESSPLTEPQTLWIYAVFSASILRGIGKIITEFRIDICNQHGQVSQQWQPYNGSMLSLDSHYQYHFLKPQPDAFKRRNTLLLARQLMPAEGFRWITSNSEVLRIWQALLDEDDRSAGSFGHVISQADADAIARSWQQTAVTDLVDIDSDFAGFLDNVEDRIDPHSHEDNEGKFLADISDWIRRQLESGELLINRQHLFAVAGGLLITSDLFRLFVQNYPEYQALQSMQTAFGSGQGLISAGLQGDLATFIHTQDGTKVSGVVLNNPHLVLPQTFKQAQANGQVQTITAQEFSQQSSELVAVTSAAATVHQKISPTGQLETQTSSSAPTVGRSRFAPFG